MNALFLFVTACLAAAPASTLAGSPSPTTFPPPAALPVRSDTGLSLDQARAMALELSPSVAAAAAATRAADQRVLQAGLWPNPELEVEAENFAGSAELSGFDGAEITGVLSQEILLGGKIAGRKAVAEADSDLASRDLEVSRLDLLAAVTSRFYRVLVAQQRCTLAEELLALAESTAATVNRRVEAGKVSPVEANRVRIQVAGARTAIEDAHQDLEAARVMLASSWGSHSPTFATAVGPLPPVQPPPPMPELLEAVEEVPEIRRLAHQVRRREMAAREARALAVPDLRLSVGPRRHRETSTTSWVAGLSVPLPLFDRNQGERRAADYEIEISRREAAAGRAGIEALVVATAHRLTALAARVEALEVEVIPAAEEVIRATEIGYREGKLGLLAVLDSQHIISAAREQRLDALEAYLDTRVAIERLLGRPLHEVTASTETKPAAADREVQP